MKIKFLFIALLLMIGGIWGCSSSTSGVKQTNIQQSQENSLQTRFRKAYNAIVCIANPGVDPDMGLVNMKPPELFIQEAKSKGDDADLQLIEEAVKKNGFNSLKDFLNAMEELQKDKTYWNHLQDGIMDALKNCP